MILSITQTRSGNATVVTATSSLTGDVSYYWSLDGAFITETTSGMRTFVMTAGDQSRIDVLDSTDSTFDPITNAPQGWPARRTLSFVRSIDPNIAKYRIEQQRAADAWTVIGFVQDGARRWSYLFVTPRLDDLTTYAWRVIPIDTAGNAGTAASLGSETIVRTPDAPGFSIAFDSPSGKVTFS